MVNVNRNRRTHRADDQENKRVFAINRVYRGPNEPDRCIWYWLRSGTSFSANKRLQITPFNEIKRRPRMFTYTQQSRDSGTSIIFCKNIYWWWRSSRMVFFLVFPHVYTWNCTNMFCLYPEIPESKLCFQLSQCFYNRWICWFRRWCVCMWISNIDFIHLYNNVNTPMRMNTFHQFNVNASGSLRKGAYWTCPIIAHITVRAFVILHRSHTDQKPQLCMHVTFRVSCSSHNAENTTHKHHLLTAHSPKSGALYAYRRFLKDTSNHDARPAIAHIREHARQNTHAHTPAWMFTTLSSQCVCAYSIWVCVSVCHNMRLTNACAIAPNR